MELYDCVGVVIYSFFFGIVGVDIATIIYDKFKGKNKCSK